MEAVRAAAPDLGGIKPACEALGASRAMSMALPIRVIPARSATDRQKAAPILGQFG
jgi:hypothetical protein